MAADPGRQNIKPAVREEIETHVTALNALTFSATVVDTEAEALRDAVVAALQSVFGRPS